MVIEALDWASGGSNGNLGTLDMLISRRPARSSLVWVCELSGEVSCPGLELDMMPSGAACIHRPETHIVNHGFFRCGQRDASSARLGCLDPNCRLGSTLAFRKSTGCDGPAAPPTNPGRFQPGWWTTIVLCRFCANSGKGSLAIGSHRTR